MNILVVDDDARLCRAVVDELTRLGHEATPAYSAKSALEILFSENIDILVTDLRMSGKDGIELIDLARGASPQTRTLLMSAYATAQDYKSAIAMGAVDVLTKPFTPKDLEQAIQKATDCLDGYHGNIHGLTLPDILQAFALARSSITVHVGTHGLVHVLRGDVVHAEVGDLVGLDALREILNGRSGRVHTSPSRDGVPHTIEGRLDHLLIALQTEAETPNPPSSSSPGVPAAPTRPSAAAPAPASAPTRPTSAPNPAAATPRPTSAPNPGAAAPRPTSAPNPAAAAPRPTSAPNPAAAVARPSSAPAAGAPPALPPKPLGPNGVRPLAPPVDPADTASTVVERVEATNVDPAEPFFASKSDAEVMTPVPEEKKRRGAFLWIAVAAALLLGVFLMWPDPEPVAFEPNDVAAEAPKLEPAPSPEPAKVTAALDAPVDDAAPDLDDEDSTDDETVEPGAADSADRPKKKRRRRRRVTRASATEDTTDGDEDDDTPEPEPEPVAPEPEPPVATTPPPSLPIIQDDKPRLDVLDDEKPRIGTIGDERPNVGTLED